MTATPGLEELYRELDARLAERAAQYPRRAEPLWSELQRLLEAVTERLWERPADTEAPPDGLEELTDRPVFVLGYYKSGTTLLLNLLDGHPDVFALPGESRHFPRFAEELASLPSEEERLRRLHAAWIRRLITPYGIPPFWALGEPWQAAEDPYRLFTAHLLRFAGARDGEDLLGAVAQAMAAATGASPRLWAEKTPTHEFHLKRILAEYPEARFVHIVRDPRSTLNSILRFGGDQQIADPLTAAAELGRSFALAREWQRKLPSRYLVLRYEDLVEEPADSMRRVAEMLEIPYGGTLATPTVGGRPATANAGVAERRVVGRVHRLSLGETDALDDRTRAVVAALAGRESRALGYDVPPGNPAVRLAARVVLWSRFRIPHG